MDILVQHVLILTEHYRSSFLILQVLSTDHSDHAVNKLDGRNSSEEMDLVRRLHGKKRIFFVLKGQ